MDRPLGHPERAEHCSKSGRVVPDLEVGLKLQASFDLATVSQELIQRGDDRIAFRLQRFDKFPEILVGNRDDFEWMQNDGLSFDPKGWIETRIRHLAQRGFIHQRHHDAASVVVVQTGLNYNDKRNRIPMPARVAVNVELGHQSVE